MAEIVNLRLARKARARAQKQQDAATNRALHGEPKPARKARELEQARDARTLDGKKRESD